MPNTVDLVKLHPEWYRGSREWREVELTSRRFVLIDGFGAPGAEAFQSSIGALYSLVYTLKFALKKAAKDDFKIAPLEAWWYMTDAKSLAEASWTLGIPIPETVADGDILDARSAAAAKRPNPALEHVRFEHVTEGRCLQRLNVGPYESVGAAVSELHDHVLPERGLRATGQHHEIYLSDPNRTAPERIKTLLRQAVTTG